MKIDIYSVLYTVIEQIWGTTENILFGFSKIP
jgi:hypothetical protein